MAERLKNIFFTKSSVKNFTNVIGESFPEFNREKFSKLIYTNEWEGLELKQKMRHISFALKGTLPENFEKACEILKKAAPEIKGFEAMSLPDFVEVYGLDFPAVSLNALYEFTKYSSSEFAIRPFIKKHPDKVMKMMYKWSADKNTNVRRFSSEGCRPRLPWAMALNEFKKDPSPILKILENLKNDESDFVRRSVANNLNDISKDNPGVVLETCENWYGQSERTDWIIKHACRTLLKSGNKRALILFGYSDPGNIHIENFNLKNDPVKIGEYLYYSFEIEVKEKIPVKVRLEYKIDYKKANGKLSGKIFKITENTFKPGTRKFEKRHSFAEMTTRKHYPGEHRISIIVNGEKKATSSFNVTKS